MAGKSKSLYLTVAKRSTHETVLTKIFYNAQTLNEFIKSEEFKNKYPSTEFYFVKEVY